jgi:ParB-like chromosome segregation protein Spo0J
MKKPVRFDIFAPDDIVVGVRLRPLDADRVTALAESIGKIGLRHPVSIRLVDGEAVLIAGQHRVEACRIAGIQFVECAIFDGDEADAKLWEISENLHRAELTEEERRQHIAEWVRITADKVLHGATPSAGGVQPRDKAISKAAKELGINKSTVSRAVAAESLSDEVKTAANDAGLGTVKRAEISREPSAEKQLAFIKREKETAAAAKRNRETDKAIAFTEAQQFADWLMARTDMNELPVLISWLEGCKFKEVIVALRRQAA